MKIRRTSHHQKGFTLIELLISIIIIGILSTLVMANVLGARIRARDAQRKSDLRQIQSALEMYRADVASYPAAGSGAYPSTCGKGSSITNAPTTPAVTYMQIIPCDPSTGQPYQYLPGVGTPILTYQLRVCLENGQDSQKDPIPSPVAPIGNYCNETSNYALTVSNP